MFINGAEAFIFHQSNVMEHEWAVDVKQRLSIMILVFCIYNINWSAKFMFTVLTVINTAATWDEDVEVVEVIKYISWLKGGIEWNKFMIKIKWWVNTHQDFYIDLIIWYLKIHKHIIPVSTDLINFNLSWYLKVLRFIQDEYCSVLCIANIMFQPLPATFTMISHH